MCCSRPAGWRLPAPVTDLSAPPKCCASRTKTEVPVEKDAPSVQGHPLTSVVVTQCNLIVAGVPDTAGRPAAALRSQRSVPADQLLQMAYTATRSERVEVSCNDAGGAVGYEKHDPV